ncbi:MAG: hypothetical protein ACI9W6_001512 [Motiliproteus sp.]|jgi:hypothetical protein
MSVGRSSGQAPDIYLFDTRASQRQSQHLGGTSGGHHIIDQRYMAAPIKIQLISVNPERMAKIAASLFSAETLLMRGVEYTAAGFGIDLDAESRADAMGQLQRLVETSLA